MRVVLINTPDGQYHLPLSKVAENRADYYATVADGLTKDSPEWKSRFDEEVSFIMNGDDYDGIDWLLGSTDWSDWESVAVKVNNNAIVRKEDFWCSSDDFEVIEI